MTPIRLELPMPPSANALFAGVARRHKTSSYRAWQAAAVAAILEQQRRHMLLQGRVYIDVRVARPKRRRDLDNCLKPLIDALVKARVIVDDAQVEHIFIAWADGIEGAVVLVSGLPIEEAA